MRALVFVGSLVSAVSVSPTEKVVQLLQDMSAKGKERMQQEQISYAKFSTFCDNEQGSLKKEIEEGKALIESLSASVQKATADAATLGDEIAGLNRDLDGYESDIAKQKADREATHKEFVASQRDLSESVDALSRAIVILKRQSYDRKQAASFLQTSKEIPARAKMLIADFMAMDSEQDPDYMAREAPEANAYEFQGGGIVEMLKKLQTKFKKELSDTEMAETRSRQAFEMALQDLTAAVADTKESTQKKTTSRNKRLVAKGKAEKELGVAQTTLKENEATLTDLTTECHEKGLSYEEKQKLSQDELEALGEAIKILSSGAADYMQTSSSTSLLQISSKVVSEQKQASDVLKFLTEQGKKIHSEKLALLASKLTNDPFVKVKKMIKAMVTKLMNEQNEEAETKGFCDKELRTNKMTRDKLAAQMDQLQAEYDEESATAKQLGELVSKLSAEVAASDAAVKEAIDQRIAENNKNNATIKDAKAAQQAVAAATAVLKEFYDKAARATAFVQIPKMGSDEWNALANPNFEGGGAGYGQGSEDKVDKGHKAGMQTFGDSSQGQQDSAHGVLAMLEVIMSDFANLETETATSEAESQKMHERFVADSKKEKMVKNKQIEMNQADKEEAEHNAAQAKRDLSTTDDQLLAADRYYESLKPKCVDEGVSFEERDAKRKEEIASLKEALQMLQPQE